MFALDRSPVGIADSSFEVATTAESANAQYISREPNASTCDVLS